MMADIVIGAIVLEYELSDHRGRQGTLSALEGGSDGQLPPTVLAFRNLTCWATKA